MDNLSDFYSAMNEALLLYDVTFNNEDDFAEIGLIAYEKFGTKNIRTYHYAEHINCDTLSIELPCNCDIIEAVTYNWEDWNYTTNYSNEGDINSAFTELYIEMRKRFHSPDYAPGKLAHFERDGNTLYFDRNYGLVHIFYKGVLLDDDGLPKLTSKLVSAIALFAAYTLKFKQGLATNNKTLLEASSALRTMWLTACDLARVPDYLTINDMNDILEAKSSWNRKIHSKSFKPIY